MITKIVIENFKKFNSAAIEFYYDTTLFVGQNNGGKTTALQAISLWSFLIQQWRTKKGESAAKKRTGAPITRNEVYASPVREMKMLWHNGLVQDGESKKVAIKVTAYGIDRSHQHWEYGIQIIYANQELFFCKPTDHTKPIPPEVDNVFHLPPLSGVQTSERRMDLGARLKAVGEGRPGEILRNLLWELCEKYPAKWKVLTTKVEALFAVELQPIRYNAQVDSDIVVYYKPVSKSKDKMRMKLEIANSGSGFLQFLLLAAFSYAHENAVLLVDEPDSHMHVFLQRGMYDWLQEVARQNNSQLVVSTHSEVLVNATDSEKTNAFFGQKPKKVGLKRNDRLVAALRGISTLDLVNIEWTKRIFFAEGDSDLRILKAWAASLDHPVSSKLDQIYFFPLETNNIAHALKHFTNLRNIVDFNIKAICLRDKTSITQSLSEGFEVYYWQRAEIENYLVHPDALIRFLEKNTPGDLFTPGIIEEANKFLEDNLPPKVLRNPVETGISENGSEFLAEFFKHVHLPIRKSSYWEIAQVMQKNEVPREVHGFLDKLNKFLD